MRQTPQRMHQHTGSRDCRSDLRTSAAAWTSSDASASPCGTDSKCAASAWGPGTRQHAQTPARNDARKKKRALTFSRATVSSRVRRAVISCSGALAGAAAAAAAWLALGGMAGERVLWRENRIDRYEWRGARRRGRASGTERNAMHAGMELHAGQQTGEGQGGTCRRERTFFAGYPTTTVARNGWRFFFWREVGHRLFTSTVLTAFSSEVYISATILFVA